MTVYRLNLDKDKQDFDIDWAKIFSGAIANKGTASTPKVDKITFKIMPKVKRIEFFNEKATVVTWADGTVTRVTVGKNDTFSEEHGFAMAIAKKFAGSYESFANTLSTRKKVKKTKQGDSGSK